MRRFLCRALVAALAALAFPAVAPAQDSMTAPGSSITPAMRATFVERMRLIDQFMGAVDRGNDAHAVTAANGVWLREMLYGLSLDQLRALPTPASYVEASAAVVQVRDATPQLGSFSNELVYFPITPCRYIDTRVVGGPLVVSRTYDLSFTGGAFGGSIACDPKQAVGGLEDRIGALAINVAIVGPTTMPGFIGVRPAGSSTTTALVNWWEQGAGVQASNAGIVTTDQGPAAAEIEFFGGPTQFVVDVFGVFAAPTATAVACVVGTQAAATLNTTTRDYALTAGACPAGYRMMSVNCGVSAGDFTQGHLRQVDRGISNPGPAPTCTGRYTGSTSVTVTAQAMCCRVPGR